MFILIEDNAPSHSSYYTTREREKEGIQKVNWPPNSPDLNPIEHIWALMKSRIQTQQGIERIKTLSQMKTILIEEWDHISIEEINKEVAKLPTILTRCIAVNSSNNFHA